MANLHMIVSDMGIIVFETRYEQEGYEGERRGVGEWCRAGL